MQRDDRSLFINEETCRRVRVHMATAEHDANQPMVRGQLCRSWMTRGPDDRPAFAIAVCPDPDGLT